MSSQEDYAEVRDRMIVGGAVIARELEEMAHKIVGGNKVEPATYELFYDLLVSEIFGKTFTYHRSNFIAAIERRITRHRLNDDHSEEEEDDDDDDTDYAKMHEEFIEERKKAKRAKQKKTAAPMRARRS